ncbi:MAG TPA: dTDP-4-dehydrorhamnose 3,5-epimerase [Thermoleophilaceae bacterium]
MRRIDTRLAGPVLIEGVLHGDARGFFTETYRRDAFAQLGVDAEFVQDNHSRSSRGVLRGLHYQVGQAKLVRCSRGSIVDVWVDLRRGSPTFGEWESAELSDENARQIFIPDGFAHGFCVTSDLADVTYKVSTYYDPSAEAGIAYDDPDIAIGWPDIELSVSERDAGAPRLADVADSLPFVY